MEKYIVLPFSKPIINHIPTDASRLSILAAQNQVLPIVHNFMNIFAFSIKTNEDNYILDTQFYWNINEIERKLIPKVIITDIVPLLWNSLQNNYYINICTDRCKLSSYKSHDINKVFPHQMCIYGMDLEKKICYCADFFSEKGYEETCVKIEDLQFANDSLQNEVCNLDPLTGATDWVSDIELLKPLLHYNQSLNLELIYKSIQNFLEGRNIFGYTSYTRKRPHVMTYRVPQNGRWLYEADVVSECYGIDVFYEIKHFLSESSDCSEYLINRKMFYIIYAYQKLMLYRLQYLSQNVEGINLANIIKQYEKLLADSQVILYNGIKLEITNQEKIKVKVITLIDTHIKNTKQILSEFWGIIYQSIDEKRM